MKIRIFCASLTIIIMMFSSKAYLQTSRHNLTFHLGYGIGSPDTRYDFLYDQYPILIIEGVQSNLKDATFDDEVFLGISYNYQIAKRLNLGLGIGYAQLKQDFFLPANGTYFKQEIRPFFWRDYSRWHLVQLSPEIKLDLINYKSLTFGINTRFVSNISFRKEINYNDGTSNDLAVNRTEFFATELFPGIFSSFKRFRFDISYRVLHWKYQDDAIANNGLRVNTYNPSKWRFQVSYAFWRSKEKEEVPSD